MPSVKDKMLEARALIKHQEYDKARAILKTTSHPKAKQWLAKLDEKYPSKKFTMTPRKTLIAIIVVLLLFLSIFFILDNARVNNAWDSYDQRRTRIQEECGRIYPSGGSEYLDCVNDRLYGE